MRPALPIDHVVILVSALDRAGSAFEAAGFTVTRETRHSPAMGTANRCIMLDGSYIELMGIVAETEANATWRRLLAAGGGIRGLALASAAIGRSASALQDAGVAAEAPRHFSRETAAGELRFSVVRIDAAETPGLQCLVCQHHTAELLWLPETMRHGNGARRLQQVQLASVAGLERLQMADAPAPIPVVAGSDRLVISGGNPAVHDLRETCGVEIEVVPA